MKFSASVFFASVAYAAAVNTTAEFSLEKRDTQPTCETSGGSPFENDMQSCVQFLWDMGSQRCQLSSIQPQPGDGQIFCTAGTAQFGSTSYMKPGKGNVCGAGAPLYIACNKLGDYYWNMKNTCRRDGRVGGYQFINGYDIQGCYGYNHESNIYRIQVHHS